MLAMPSWPEVMIEAAKLGTSPADRVPHAGAAETDPLPVCVRNYLVADVLPASRVPAPEAPP